MTIIASLVIALVLGGGTSFAAQSALPGDVLYRVKADVNEEVIGALTFSTEGKANWNARRAERRLEEAATLAAEGKLNAEVRADAEARLKRHVSDSEGEARKLESGGQNEAAIEARSDLESRLEGHASIAALLNVYLKGENRDQTEKLLEVVRAEAEAVAEARAQAEANIGARAEVSVESKIKVVEEAMVRVKAAISEADTSNRPQVIAEVEGRIDFAEDALVLAQAELKGKNINAAYEFALKADRAVKECLILLKNKNAVNVTIGEGVEIDIEESRNGSSSDADEDSARDGSDIDDNAADRESRSDESGAGVRASSSININGGVRSGSSVEIRGPGSLNLGL